MLGLKRPRWFTPVLAGSLAAQWARLKGPQISAERSHRKFLVGLTGEQKQKFKEAMSEQWGTTGMLIR
jgi:hypothetical protein